jgi:EAL domain-containing protein (putative c-di-GMP-specific phosphodiesterase class I)
MPQRKGKARIDAAAGTASPLGVAISENDRQTMTMVRAALDLKLVKLAFQPVVLAREPNRVAFYEALIRLLDSSGRIIPARDFMGAVEATEMGREIDCVALELGLDTLTRHPELRIAINMSARSIGYPRFQRVMDQGLARSPSVAERLILEITEDSAMLVPEIVTAFMDDLREKGVAFALDDFGAGTIVIRYLKDFFFDMVKIDGQFVRNLHLDRGNQTVAAALIGVAKQFDMYVVAEAVESEAEAAVLRTMGVDCLQGYLYGAPTVKPFWLRDDAKRA